MGRKYGRTNKRTDIRTDKRKDENYIPLGINARGIIINPGTDFSTIVKVDSYFPNENIEVAIGTKACTKIKCLLQKLFFFCPIDT